MFKPQIHKTAKGWQVIVPGRSCPWVGYAATWDDAFEIIRKWYAWFKLSPAEKAFWELSSSSQLSN